MNVWLKAGMPVTISGFEIFAKRFGASRHPGKPSERLETAHFSLIWVLDDWSISEEILHKNRRKKFFFRIFFFTNSNRHSCFKGRPRIARLALKILQNSFRASNLRWVISRSSVGVWSSYLVISQLPWALQYPRRWAENSNVSVTFQPIIWFSQAANLPQEISQ